MAAARDDGESGAAPGLRVCEREDLTEKRKLDKTDNMSENPFHYLIEPLPCTTNKTFFNVSKLQATDYDCLPYCIRVILEAAVRNCDGVLIKEEDARNILSWKTNCNHREVPFLPARVLLQDFTGIPAMVDFAAMRDAVKKFGKDAKYVNPACPTDLVTDHSLQLDFTKCSAAQSAPCVPTIEMEKPAAKLSPAKTQGRKPNCRGQGSNCKGACDSGSSTSSSRSQIENTPILCPFHLQPIPEPETALKSIDMEFSRNKERLQFFKWCSKAFQNVNVIPPETGTVHQVNLEFLSRVVMEEKNCMYPDSVLGTDSHTTMVNGLGILGWGVGGIESEAAMLGVPITLTLPEVVGCELTGSVSLLSTSIDVVLSITKHLRQAGLAGRFVEFFGTGVSQLSVADRTTIANMCPEYGATVAFFPMDRVTMSHLKQTGIDPHRLRIFEAYLKAVKLLREEGDRPPEYSKVLQINLSSIVPYVSGPKRSQDRVSVNDMKKDFQTCLNEKAGIRAFHISAEKQNTTVPVIYGSSEYQLSHGCVVIAALISCTNNCNPSVMLTAGLLAKKAVEAGLTVKPYIKTSLSPGSGTVTHYLTASGVLPYLNQLGFDIIGYGCARCVGNTNPLPEEIVTGIKEGELVACGVFSGSKHFEGHLCDCIRANYLASPPLVIAYALAGTVNIDLHTEALGENSQGKKIYLRDIWPSREEVLHVEENFVIPSMFTELKEKIEKQNTRWNLLDAPDSTLFPWDTRSTYIRSPPFFHKLEKTPLPLQPIEKAHVLLYLGDSVTTDHISPAGSISRTSPAAKYLIQKCLAPREFNSYGARRGNDAVMTRGTFANMKLFNKLIGKTGPKTIHVPTGQTLDVFEAAELYQKADIPLIIIAGKKYGSGNSRDWAAKGPFLLGVKAVIAQSYEKIHKDHLVGIGIAPFQFLPGESAESLNLCGKEQYSISISEDIIPGATLEVKTNKGKVFHVIAAFNNEAEVTFYKHGGILSYVARKYL